MNREISHLAGCTLEGVHHDSESDQWVFAFSGRVVLQVSAPWRVVSQGRIYLGYQDDGHLFGLPKPLSATERLAAVIVGRQVDVATLGAYGDLAVRFPGDSTLEVFNSSGGYEGWQVHGPGNRYVIGYGGGAVVDSGGDG